ncbi:MAG: Nif3-like dinuclear metal center hexameric protein [Deltaproteobacteria bacterium]|nr:Nif3-like dinuclear metal center hexameric protein [Deltaproteobacteria bacterium]
MTTVADILKIVETIYPPDLAEEWDRIGLQLGDPGATVTGVATALESDLGTVRDAVARGANCLVAHHPLLFHPLKRVTPRDPIGAIVIEAIKHDVAIIAAHTNADWAEGGLNDFLAKQLGLLDVRPMTAKPEFQEVKLVTFIPHEHLEAVTDAMFAAGAGVIGDYAKCSYQVDGYGTFLPGEDADPFSGEKGKVAREAEVRVEVVVPEKKLPAVVDALRQAHPYEEPAYDVYPLKTNPRNAGVLRIGRLESEQTVGEVIARLKAALGVQHLRAAGPDSGVVEHVAICTGGGAGFLSSLPKSPKTLFITGDVKYHDAVDATRLGIPLIDAGHFASEIAFAELTAGKLRSHFAHGGIDLPVHGLTVEKDPLRTV